MRLGSTDNKGYKVINISTPSLLDGKQAYTSLSLKRKAFVLNNSGFFIAICEPGVM